MIMELKIATMTLQMKNHRLKKLNKFSNYEVF